MYPIVSENDNLKIVEEFVRMEDGIRLYTFCACPKKKEHYPIVFIREPYANPHYGVPADLQSCESNIFIQNEYALVIQHCRGTGNSEGVCIPYNERDDGLETLEYIRKLPFYNGEIYVEGGSYRSTVHLTYIDTNPPDIKGAALAIQTDRMYFRNYRNGCCYDFCNLDWWLSMIKREYPNQTLDDAIKRPYKDIMKRIIGTEYSTYTNLLLNNKYNDFWKNDPRTHAIEGLEIPVLFTEGWYDYYLEGMFSMWQRMPEKTKQKSAMVVGPWGHSTHVINGAAYPLNHGNLKKDFVVEWFNSIRYARPYKYAETNKVNYYSIGGDFWTTADYPSSPQDICRLYFNLADGLTKNPLAEEQEDMNGTRYYESIPFVFTGNAVMYCDNVSTPGRYLERYDGDKSELLFDIVAVSKKERTIHIIRIGAGEDRIVKY